MSNMQDFVQTAMKSLGTSEDATRTATGGLLQMIQKQVGDTDFSQLAGKLSGSAEMLKSAPGESSGAGGMLGGLMSKAAGAIGGDLGAAASAFALFKQTGFDKDQATKFVSMFVDFAKDHAGADIVGKILGKMPELKKLVD